ncbi:ComEC/Rec2 family competence protein [Winogradskyella litorisediminis]|uniref:ComEC/Rec2 family competence protein n=1 Tax=Winogradskyella litorisediminis TaxID=1156618 RepID=A0ABW3N487_9FLAO
MKLLNFNIIILTICLIIGICLGFYFEISLTILLSVFGILLVGLLTVHILKRTYASRTFGVFALLIFISIGFIRSKLYDDTHQKSHYTNSDINYEVYQDFTLRIKERLKPDNYNYKFIAVIESLNNKSVSGKLLINFKKDSIFETIKIDDILFANTQLLEVVKPKNPNQFDYNGYLKERNIYHQAYLNSSEIILLKSTPTSVYGYADAFRNKVNIKLKQQNFSSETLSIINALLLGQRQDISEETYNNYVNAGTIHILAVSGLHVGIIYLILSFLLKPLHRLRHGKFFIKPILIILILWAFAFIAGLSPSVTRAVTMFSIIAFADFYKRPKNIINTLVISAFILLLIKPIYLFDVGFQMSYLAVLAIVTIQPLIYKLWQPRFWLIDKFWQIFTVTLAAQAGVAPISLFYFHQFPGLFFLSNLVIIPFLGLILGFGILIIFLSLLDLLPEFLAKAFNTVIESLNGFIAWVAQFENFLLRDISFSIYHIFASYLFITSLIYLWKQKSLKALQFSLISILAFSVVLIYTKNKNNYSEFVIFNKTRATIISEKSNSSLLLFHNLDTDEINKNKSIKNYAVANFTSEVSNKKLSTVYKFDDEIFLIVDSLGVYEIKSFQPSYILLKDSPKINLNRLIDSIKPQLIIADASNYKSYVKRWKATCEHKNIPFHSTFEKGAFVLKSD